MTSEKPGQNTELTPDKLDFDMFCDLLEDELYIKFMETGAYYEIDQEDWLELEYEEYANS